MFSVSVIPYFVTNDRLIGEKVLRGKRFFTSFRMTVGTVLEGGLRAAWPPPKPPSLISKCHFERSEKSLAMTSTGAYKKSVIGNGAKQNDPAHAGFIICTSLYLKNKD